LAIFVIFKVEGFAETETENLQIWVCLAQCYTYVAVGIAQAARIYVGRNLPSALFAFMASNIIVVFPVPYHFDLSGRQ
jgi:hypothetical protein